MHNPPPQSSDIHDLTPPEPGTLERWAFDYLRSDTLEHKLHPCPIPTSRAALCGPVRVPAPGRPRELSSSWDKYKAPKSAHALRDPKKRAHLLHTFLHHELQAAELMCWAVLAFPDVPLPFARGLLNICSDEIRHMGMYRAQLRRLGYEVGSFPVRDWFWERAPAATGPHQFLALMGLGFEAGNLDHSARFEKLFAEAGDLQAAELMHCVGEEEVDHVSFAAHWFERLCAPFSFQSWERALPPPLSPMLMRGKPLARERRLRAGFDDTFQAQLSKWQPA